MSEEYRIEVRILNRNGDVLWVMMSGLFYPPIPMPRLDSEKRCQHEFVDSDGGFKGICKKCGELKDGEKR